MRRNISSTPSWMILIKALGLYVGIAVAIGAFYWWIGLTLGGHTLAQALGGQVEDAMDTLEAVTLLASLVGAFTGLVYAFGAITSPTEKQGNQQEENRPPCGN
jgi:hypothetical protein